MSNKSHHPKHPRRFVHAAGKFFSRLFCFMRRLEKESKERVDVKERDDGVVHENPVSANKINHDSDADEKQEIQPYDDSLYQHPTEFSEPGNQMLELIQTIDEMGQRIDEMGQRIDEVHKLILIHSLQIDEVHKLIHSLQIDVNLLKQQDKRANPGALKKYEEQKEEIVAYEEQSQQSTNNDSGQESSFQNNSLDTLSYSTKSSNKSSDYVSPVSNEETGSLQPLVEDDTTTDSDELQEDGTEN